MNRAYDLAESRTADNDFVGVRTARQNKRMQQAKGGWRRGAGSSAVGGRSAGGGHRGRLEEIAPFAADPPCWADLWRVEALTEVRWIRASGM